LKRFVFPIAIVLIASSLGATAQSRRVSGIVTNGTTHKPAAGDDVILIRLGKGMEEESRTKTDSRGAFNLNMANGNDLHLIRVRHDNVNYHEPVPPGTSNFPITVYNAVSNVPGLKMLDQSEVFQASNSQLQVIDVIRVSNTADPPVTQPSLDIYLPEGASVKLSRAASENGMPVNATVVPQKEKNKYTILHPIRPGSTHIELVYEMPYTGKISLQPKLTIPADHFYVVTAKGIRFEPGPGSSFETTTQWPADPTVTGVDIHAAGSVPPEKELAFVLTGAGVLPDQGSGQGGQGAQGGGSQAREDNRPGGGLGEPNERPDPLRSGQWVFLGVLSLFLAAGATYVYTASNEPAAAPAKKPTSGPGLLLDAMKEEMFQLETDRIAGKISPEEYDAAKAAMDQTLQRAIRRQKSK
jgi:hypothetical protein